MLDKVWSFIRNAPAGLYRGGHNVMLYKDDRPDVEVGVQVTRPFEETGDIHCSNLPGGLVATARHSDPMPAIGETHRAIVEWCAANGYQTQGQRWEVYGDPDPTGQFAVDIFWLLHEDRAEAAR
jgi:effector-binding domain-containing protein